MRSSLGHRTACLGLAFTLVSATMLADIRRADACGCLSPPAVTAGDYAVNQRAEQIIFEVEPGWVTAHVLIKYAGAPESFAWIIPVPEIPELAISPVTAFGLIDRASTPLVDVYPEDICPTSSWACRYHQSPDCGGWGLSGEDGAGGGDSAPASDASSGGQEPPPVTIIDQKVVGDYQTVTFRADEAGAATTWLRANGFIVNQTTSIYMEPYVQAGMVFVAAKLVAGAGVDAIKPLKLKYRSNFPMVPLVLTAVAAEPNLTVTSFIYGNHGFKPMNHPVVTIDPKRIARDGAGRLNYPMVLARTVDEAGGDGFAIEYRGGSPRTTFSNNMCCSGGYDFCNIGHNGTCECPGSDIDANDCSSQSDLLDGIDLVDKLADKYTTMTRITTRVSAEEMTFDPTFEIDYGTANIGRLTLQGSQVSLSRCGADVVDYDQYQDLVADQNCAAMYCGPGGRCVQTTAGAACACDEDKVAQRYFDLDNQASVTCVPRTPTVDLRAGGDVLPDACSGVSCGAGACVDRNGVAVCDCTAGAAAIVGTGTAPRCFAVTRGGNTAGAQDYSEALRDLDVCAPPAPSCGEGGWLVKVGSARPGVSCPNRSLDPPEYLREPGPPPTCDGFFNGCAGCSTENGGGEGPFAAIGGAWVLALVMFRRRKKAR